MSICPVAPTSARERAVQTAARQEEARNAAIGELERRLFGLERQLGDLPIATLGQQTKAIADAVLGLESLRRELPALLAGTIPA